MYRAKYIEGLENRLGRMEALLKMSGLLTEEEAGKTDLGTIERRLAEKARLNSMASLGNSPQAEPTPPFPLRHSDSQVGTPQKDVHISPRASAESPVSPSKQEKAQEVENLSELMCSLVTTSNGETRYIGIVLNGCNDIRLIVCRFILSLLYLFLPRHRLDQ